VPVNFFEREVQKVQQRFNETFGVLDFCDLKMRHKVILKIVSMMRLKDRIIANNKVENIQEERSKFVRIRDCVNSIFNQIDQELNERRSYAKRNIVTGNHQDGAGIVRRGR